MRFFLVFLCTVHFHPAHSFFDITDVISRNMTRLPKDFSIAIKDIAQGLPVKSLTIVRGKSTSIRLQDMFQLMCLLNTYNIQVINLDITTPENKERYYKFLKVGLDTSDERTSLILCEPFECEKLISELTGHNLIHRTILYMFYWAHGNVSEEFLSTMKEAMRIVVVTNPRSSVVNGRKSIWFNRIVNYFTSPNNNDCTVLLKWLIVAGDNGFRVYYNQGTSNRLHHLSLVNWWSGRLYKSPLLPPTSKVYQDFQGRIFEVPVLHAPPWHFVKYKNDSTVEVTGGRDDKLLDLLAKKLNFKYRYYDPPERSQGSSISGNGTFKGTLGLIWKRKADFFLGDVTMTWERLQAVEFSFLTLADSGAFLTHAPAKLSETLAIIRPFRWEVWPLVLVALLITGPALWMVIAAPSLWQNHHCDQLELLNNCCWFTTTLFLKQSSSKEPSKTHKARLVSVLISLGATYVIGDMYSANLTSLLARPAREQPIGTLQALEEAMRDNGYELVVERHSSSLTMLQNGTGVYGRLARLMRRQRIQRVRSVEVGVRMVLSRKRVAILGGRETLYYDTERFGSHNFHLSEKLYTRYSAIALQIGCPYLETFNSVVMTLFEAGILSKMTTDEYRNLPEQSRRSEPVTESDQKKSDATDYSGNTSQQPTESTIGLEPVSLRMLHGAFCLLGIGYSLATITVIVEIQVHRRAPQRDISKESHPHVKRFIRIKKRIRRKVMRIVRAIYRHIDRALGPGF